MKIQPNKGLLGYQQAIKKSSRGTAIELVDTLRNKEQPSPGLRSDQYDESQFISFNMSQNFHSLQEVQELFKTNALT